MAACYFTFSDIPGHRPKPLVAAIRVLIAGGLVAGAGVAPAKAELPTIAPTQLPIPAADLGAGATVSATANTMTVTQTADKVNLKWDRFDIGNQAAVRFAQPSATSIAVNNIGQRDASQILGTLTANGQVYLINQNGFLFGKDSQINVNSLVASTLGISEAGLKSGITKAFDLDKGAAALQGSGATQYIDINGKPVKIEIFVQPGAKIKTHGDGGRVIIAAPSITNHGDIETPDGQTILAAAKDKVYLQEAGSDSDIRGLLVEVGTGGDVNNVGKILAERGNASLIGFAVNQRGIVSATTSTQLNGSVRLMAREGIVDPASVKNKLVGKSTLRANAGNDGLGTRATVKLGPNSVTSVDLDADKSITALDAQQQPQSDIEISGHDVQLLNNSLVQAHAGNVGIQALDDPNSPVTKGSARIYLDTGSKIDVSGVKNVKVAADADIVELKLQSNELRDTPLQRKGVGVLFGETVKVDSRDATLSYDDNGNLTSAKIPIADITGAVQRRARNIDERSTEGGTITLTSSGDVVTQVGSILDFSGGSVDHEAGYVATTKLRLNNQIIDIGKANPNFMYTGVISSPVKSYRTAFSEGKAGGSLRISSYAALLDGTLDGQTLRGVLQRQPSEWAAGSSVTIDLVNDNSLGLQNVIFGNSGSGLALGPQDALPVAPLRLSVETLRRSGVRHLTIATNGSVTVERGAQLDLPATGKLDARARNFDVQGAIVARAGEIDLRPLVVQGKAQSNAITLGSAALLDVSGLWVNDPLDTRSGRPLAEVATAGGQVVLEAEQDRLLLSDGSLIDASGGAWLKGNGRIAAGAGGKITLAAANNLASGNPASLAIEGKAADHFLAWGLEQNGGLVLKAEQVILGRKTDQSRLAQTPNPLVLDEDFFRQGGFSDYEFVANAYGLTLADNMQLHLSQTNRQLTSVANLARSGSHLRDISQAVVLPDYLRHSVDMTLSFAELVKQDRSQALTIGTGALIETGPGGSVTLNSDTSIYVDGQIHTPAGKIALNITKPKADGGYFASQGIWLGSQSRLAAEGAVRGQLSFNGLNTGKILAGGDVELTANRGFIVSAAGSVIDVSGISAGLDATRTEQGLAVLVPGKRLASAGGTIRLAAGEGILADGSFAARSGGTGAAGGSLSVLLDRGLRDKPTPAVDGGRFPDDTNPAIATTLTVSSNNANVASGKGSNVAGNLSQKALLKSALINAAGFDSISLKTDVQAIAGKLSSAIAFDGDVRLDAGRQIVLDSTTLKTGGSQVLLNAPYLALGSTAVRNDSNLKILAPDAVAGAGRFDANAQGIDLIGGLSFNGFGQVNLASQGDVRLIGDVSLTDKNFRGQVNLAGNLNIAADRIYPTTLTQYTINLTGNDASLTITGNAADNTPVLSAGGNVTVNAANIYQYGTLQAPFGSLTLNARRNLVLAAGSRTSVSGAGSVVPFGVVSGGNTWLYPLTNSASPNIVITADNLPEKSLALNGQNIDLQQGATIDLSGGGNLFAYEFIPGIGGSHDVLNPASPGYTEKYAILPGINNILTPYDPLQSSGAGLTVGESVYLDSAPGLAAGWYTLLPAHYALLPGAFLLTPKAETLGQTQTTYSSAGVPIVAGRYGVAGTAIQDKLSQGFELLPGSVFTGSLSYGADGAVVSNTNAKSPSQFDAYLADSFFSRRAREQDSAPPQLAADAGRLLLAANNRLNLSATLLANPFGKGLGGQVDISADTLRVVKNPTDLAGLAAGTVGLWANQLNELHAPSLLLGGKRAKTGGGDRITITSGTVTVDSGAVLQGQELLLAASEQVNVGAGAQILSTGKTGAAERTALVDNGKGDSNGAVLRVSAGGQLDVKRDKAANGATGILSVGEGAILQADGSILLDSSKDTRFDGVIAMNNGGSLALNSSRISIGNAPDATPGLVLANVPLALDDLRFKSAGDFDIYGNAQIASKNLSISAASINGFSQASDALAGITASETLRLSNSGAHASHAGSGIGTLQISAKNIVLGSGDYAISGFSKVLFSAEQAINGLGQTRDPATGNSVTAEAGQLTVAGDVSLSANHFSGGHGATVGLDAGNHTVNLSSPGTANADLPVGLGVSWTVKGGQINSSARFDLPSGALTLAASQGAVNLNSGSASDVSGRTMAFADRFRYAPAGYVELNAAGGDVNLAEGASINLAGARQVNNGVIRQTSDAGTLTVYAEQGQFDWLGTVDARGGAQALAGDVKHGSLQLHAKSFGSGGFTALNSKVAAAGFAEKLNLAQGEGDITIASGDVVAAKHFKLAADQGKVTVAGRIDVSGTEAGTADLYGRNGIALAATGRILAKSANGDGGSVLLDTVHRDDAGSGTLDLAAVGGVIDVSGAAGHDGGALHLRTGRDAASHQVAVTAINSRIVGSEPSRTALEAARVYTGQTEITATDIEAWRLDTADFMNAKPALANASGAIVEILPGIDIRSSGDLTLRDAWDFLGTWSVPDNGFTASWRYADAANTSSLPGFLTLQAADNLYINASLSDGLGTSPLPGAAQDPSQLFLDVIQPGLSWSYNLKAGKTINLAASYQGLDPLGSGSLVNRQVVVRSGTGAIDMAAGEDIVFNIDPDNSDRSNNASAVYTVGSVAPYTISQLLNGEIPGLPGQAGGQSLQDYLAGFDAKQLNQVLRYGFLQESFLGSRYLYAEFPTRGGDVNLAAGGTIHGVQTGQQATDWLVRSGTWGYSDAERSGYDPTPTAWGINISGNLYYSGTSGEFIMPDGETPGAIYGKDTRNFNQNVGALGGGNVSVTAKGHIKDLSVMLPSTGKPLGRMSSLDVWTDNGEPAVNGGGNLYVAAGNDIVGGEFFVALGRGDVQAGGSIGKSQVAGDDAEVGLILDLGDGTFNVRARQDIALGAVMNPTMIAQQSLPAQSQQFDTRFFSYGAQSAVNFLTTAGNLSLVNDYAAIAALKHLQGSNQSGVEYTIYPGILRAAALSGDINIEHSLSLFPSAHGELELLAYRNVGIDPEAAKGQRITVNMADTDPALLPGYDNPATNVDGSFKDRKILTRELFDPASPVPQTIHAAQPVHKGDDSKPLIMAKFGNIAFSPDEQVAFYFPQAADILAGGNIENVSISTQNLAPDDVTLIKAGGNIYFGTRLDGDGIVKSNDQFITVAGPGQLQVIAGGSVGLGSSQGIQTIGNLVNAVLGGQGASIEVLAGLSDRIDYAGFIAKYSQLDSYAELLARFERLPLTDTQKLKRDKLLSRLSASIQALQGLDNSADQGKDLQAVLKVLFQHLEVVAFQAALTPDGQRAAVYRDGSEALKTLFPGDSYSGDLGMVFSQIKTLAGGDINLLVPGGKIEVGLAGKLGGISKSAEYLGIVAQQQGDLNIFADGNINVNQSRVFTLGGGNITAWSARGSIDAGKGSKGAISAPAPLTTIDPDGNIVTVFPPIISGSGIQAIGGGDVTLAAPEGIVDAGEAGISGGDITIAATAVIGASNIQSSGSSTGVPTQVAAPSVPSGAEAAATGAARSAGDAPAAGNKDAKEQSNGKKKSLMAVLNASVVGYGQCSVADVKDGKAGCGG